MAADGERDYLGDVIRSVETMLGEKYPRAEFATLVVKLGDDLPRLVIPVFRPGTSWPPPEPSCTLRPPA